MASIGEGGFGTVVKVEHKMDGKTYALKRVLIHIGVDEDIQKHSGYKEIQAISRLCHQNIVRYFSSWVEPVVPDEQRLEKIMRHLYKHNRVQKTKIADTECNKNIDEEELSSQEDFDDLRQNE